MRIPALILVALLIAACSSGGSETPPSTLSTSTTPSATTTSVTAAGLCSDVAQEDKRVTDDLISKGCADGNGTLRFGKITQCKDGSRLWEMGDLIGLSGQLIFNRDTKAEGGIPVWSLHYRVCKG